jgi:hypothetical protein
MPKKSIEPVKDHGKSTLWEKGQSGNPAGRKPGSGIVGELRQQMQAAAPEIISKLIENAKLGDPTSVRLIVERLIPLHKPQLPLISVDIPNEGSPIDRANALLSSVLAGQISADQAAAIVNIQSSIVALRESEELERRLIALEQKAIDV